MFYLSLPFPVSLRLRTLGHLLDGDGVHCWGVRTIEFSLEAALFRDHLLGHAMRSETYQALRTRIGP